MLPLHRHHHERLQNSRQARRVVFGVPLPLRSPIVPVPQTQRRQACRRAVRIRRARLPTDPRTPPRHRQPPGGCAVLGAAAPAVRTSGAAITAGGPRLARDACRVGGAWQAYRSFAREDTDALEAMFHREYMHLKFGTQRLMQQERNRRLTADFAHTRTSISTRRPEIYMDRPICAASSSENWLRRRTNLHRQRISRASGDRSETDSFA